MCYVRDHAPQAVSDDISFIQSQNRGLQVQTQNQQMLLTELENLLVSHSDSQLSDLDIHGIGHSENCASRQDCPAPTDSRISREISKHYKD
jgi:hypothetical protein